MKGYKWGRHSIKGSSITPRVSELREKRCPSPKLYSSPTFSGQGSEMEPAKDTEESSAKKTAVLWKASLKSAPSKREVLTMSNAAEGQPR